MELSEWISKLKSCKVTQKVTSQWHVTLYRMVNDNHIHLRGKEDVCKCCKRALGNLLCVKLEVAHRMTVFEAECIYAMFLKNQRPADYANFHKLPSGQRFIENIGSIEVRA